MSLRLAASAWHDVRMVRSECAGCGHHGLTVFISMGHTPLADYFPGTLEEARNAPRYRLRAATCDKCGLAQLLDVVNDGVLYGEDYGFRTGGSPATLSYMRSLARDAVGQGPGRGLIVEVGCNDGTLMSRLIEEYRGRDVVVGIDPSGAAADDVVKKPFTAVLARDYEQTAGIVVAVNVAAHVQDPHDFLEGVRVMLRQDGIAVVEFQYFHDLLAGCMFDLIYHEHRFYYTLGSFRRLAHEHGLFVRRAVRTPAQGGSYRVTLARTGHTEYGDTLVAYEQDHQEGLLAGFGQRAWYAKNRIHEAVAYHGGKVYGYAASAKSCTLLNWCGLGPQEVPCIVDVTPGKLGRYAPGSAIPIVPERDSIRQGWPDAYLLLAQNYLGAVMRREQAKGYRGQFIVPLPLPVIV